MAYFGSAGFSAGAGRAGCAGGTEVGREGIVGLPLGGGGLELGLPKMKIKETE